MKYEITCSSCNNASKSLLDVKCPLCNGPLDVTLHFDFHTADIRLNDYSIWRFRKFFPYIGENEIVTLGEGWTPLVRLSGNVLVKLESLNPTGSFKDRGSAVLISAVHRMIRRQNGYISEDSSGNAGASMAAYAARVGIRADVYVPERVSGPKFGQIQRYGANILKVSGSRRKVAQEAQKAETGKVYVGHILHPLFRDGIRTLAYEIAEQLSWKAPEYVFLPVSAGTLLLGVVSGFKHLADSNTIKTMPKIVACQTRQVSPLYHRLKNLSYTPPNTVTSIADALVSTDPPLLDLMVRKSKEVDGDAVMVDEEEIVQSFKELAAKGFFVEPSSAVAYAGYKKRVEREELSKASSVVIILTGTGLKTAFEP